MTRKTLFCIWFLLFLFAAPILADNVQFTGTAAFDDLATGTSMSPYSGLLNSQAVNYFCVDYSTGVPSISGWTATPTVLTNSSSSYQNTLQFQLTGSNATALNNYLEMAWLSPSSKLLSTQVTLIRQRKMSGPSGLLVEAWILMAPIRRFWGKHRWPFKGDLPFRVGKF